MAWRQIRVPVCPLALVLPVLTVKSPAGSTSEGSCVSWCPRYCNSFDTEGSGRVRAPEAWTTAFCPCPSPQSILMDSWVPEPLGLAPVDHPWIPAWWPNHPIPAFLLPGICRPACLTRAVSMRGCSKGGCRSGIPVREQRRGRGLLAPPTSTPLPPKKSIPCKSLFPEAQERKHTLPFSPRTWSSGPSPLSDSGIPVLRPLSDPGITGP